MKKRVKKTVTKGSTTKTTTKTAKIKKAKVLKKSIADFEGWQKEARRELSPTSEIRKLLLAANKIAEQHNLPLVSVFNQKLPETYSCGMAADMAELVGKMLIMFAKEAGTEGPHLASGMCKVIQTTVNLYFENNNDPIQLCDWGFTVPGSKGSC